MRLEAVARSPVRVVGEGIVIEEGEPVIDALLGHRVYDNPADLRPPFRGAGKPQRGFRDGNVFDWLLWWDNSLLQVLRQHLSDALLVFVLRDPRDMLLDWLAFGSPVPLALASPDVGARWLAQSLAQIADVHEQNLFPHALIRMDEIADDATAIAQQLADTLQTRVRSADGLLGPPHFAAGHWRQYQHALGPAFALLAPVAQRLGYPAE